MVGELSPARAGVNEWTATNAVVKKKRPAIVCDFLIKCRKHYGLRQTVKNETLRAMFYFIWLPHNAFYKCYFWFYPKKAKRLVIPPTISMLFLPYLSSSERVTTPSSPAFVSAKDLQLTALTAQTLLLRHNTDVPVWDAVSYR